MILRRSKQKWLFLSLIIILSIWLLQTAQLWFEGKKVNHTLNMLQAGPYIEEDEIDLGLPNTQFAYAYHLQQRNMFESAVDAYGKAERVSEPQQLKYIYFNMGNLYLEQAIKLAEQMGIDRATALADVAKDLYKSALKIAPSFWPAKYNYEAAQRLSRDLPLGELQEGNDAEESSEELWSAMPGFPLGLP